MMVWFAWVYCTVTLLNKGRLSIKNTSGYRTPMNAGHFRCPQGVPYSDVSLYSVLDHTLLIIFVARYYLRGHCLILSVLCVSGVLVQVHSPSAGEDPSPWG